MEGTEKDLTTDGTDGTDGDNALVRFGCTENLCSVQRFWGIVVRKNDLTLFLIMSSGLVKTIFLSGKQDSDG